MKNLLHLSLTLFLAITATGQITNFNQWSLLEDPAHPQMSAAQGAVSVELIAGPGGQIPGGTDIGLASINGSMFANSNFGHGFDPASDFWIMVDFDMKFLGSSAGGLGIGFGVGENIDGSNSAGVALLTYNGVATGFPSGYYSASRTNDVTALPIPFAIAPNELINGSMSLRYFAGSGTFFVGLGALGADDIVESKELTGLQNGWADEFLFPSVFLRSDDLNGVGQGFSTDGEGSVVFSNFRVIEGASARAVPEPSAYAAIFGLVAMAIAASRRRAACR